MTAAEEELSESGLHVPRKMTTMATMLPTDGTMPQSFVDSGYPYSGLGHASRFLLLVQYWSLHSR